MDIIKPHGHYQHCIQEAVRLKEAPLWRLSATTESSWVLKSSHHCSRTVAPSHKFALLMTILRDEDVCVQGWAGR